MTCLKPGWSRSREFYRTEGFGLSPGFVAKAEFMNNGILRVDGIMGIGARITKCIPICSPGQDKDAVDFRGVLLKAMGLLNTDVGGLKTTAYGMRSSLLDAFCCTLVCSAFIEPEPPIPDNLTLMAATEELLSYLGSEEPLRLNYQFWRMVKKYATGRTFCPLLIRVSS